VAHDQPRVLARLNELNAGEYITAPRHDETFELVREGLDAALAAITAAGRIRANVTDATYSHVVTEGLVLALAEGQPASLRIVAKSSEDGPVTRGGENFRVTVKGPQGLVQVLHTHTHTPSFLFLFRFFRQGSFCLHLALTEREHFVADGSIWAIPSSPPSRHSPHLTFFFFAMEILFLFLLPQSALEDHRNGTYTATFLPERRGFYSARVTYCDLHQPEGQEDPALPHRVISNGEVEFQLGTCSPNHCTLGSHAEGVAHMDGENHHFLNHLTIVAADASGTRLTTGGELFQARFSLNDQERVTPFPSI
jgi:hypothetical protein